MEWEGATFAGGSMAFYLTAHRLRKSARKLSGLRKFRIYAPRHVAHLSPDAKRLMRTSRGKRGYGFWMWKPLVARAGLSTAASRGRNFVYLDAGCHINSTTVAARRFQEYAGLVEERGPIAMRLPGLTLAQWCKRETLEFFEISVETARTTPMFEAGVLLLGRDLKSRELIEDWCAVIHHKEGSLFSDEIHPDGEYSDFIEHRHDSAVLSCIFVATGLQGLVSETYFRGEWLNRAYDFPFWAMRNRYPFSVAPNTLGDQVKRRLLRLRGIDYPEWHER